MPTYAELLAKIAVLEEQNMRKDEDIRLKDDAIRLKDDAIRHKDDALRLKDDAIRHKDETIRNKEMRIAYLERLLFGSKSDKILSKVPANQPTLFDELFQEAIDQKQEEIEQTAKEIEAEAQKRRAKAKSQPKRPAKYLYAGLEERHTVLTPDGIDLEQYEIIGRDFTRILRREPAKVWVEVIERPVYRKKSDKILPAPSIVQAPAPKAVIGGNHIGADLLAQLIIDKYRYHLPEYRQVKQYADMGVKFSTSTVNGWIHAAAAKLEPIYEALRRDILLSFYLQIDEVPWRIADMFAKSRFGYAWQFLDLRPESHGTYFVYLGGSRSGDIPRAELRTYRGAVQTDGYAVYNYFELQANVILLGCMAHVRRKFTDAQISHPHLAKQAVEWIARLYELEANLKERNATFDEIARERQQKAIPIMDAMEKWMEAVHIHCTPSDPMGKALDYAYKLWPRLKRYALDGRYHIDNNPVERYQRPSVMGRKNYLFSKNDSGAVDNAIFYSLIESCDIVGINPLEWLTYALNNIHDDSTEVEIKQLLPFQYKTARQ